jgi:hydrogenase nickel incorporation protein HypA/HybF
MHEVGILTQVVDVVERTMEENHLTKVERVIMQIGELTTVIPEYAKDAFEMVTYKTPLEGAKLDVEFRPAVAECPACGKIFRVKNGVYRECPACGRDGATLISGKELIIKQIIAY